MIRHAAKGVALMGLALVVSAFHCSGKEVRDSEVRIYIRDKLDPYLDTLAHELCRVRAKAKKGGVGFCDDPSEKGRVDDPTTAAVDDSTTDPDGYTKPPPNGNP